MRFTANIHIMLKPTVNDPQGNAVLGGLHSLGFDEVQSARVGKYLSLELDAEDQRKADASVTAMCEKLLANTVIESYNIVINPR